ncbi:MAG: tetratricopeptide repeat protein, partial [Anaerolineales bacterium]|nr:tetratricopeptide repeat protein [Anaerolineales bacterium]
KTRLTHELALQAESQGARLLSGGEVPGASNPYHSIVEAFQSALPLLASLGSGEHRQHESAHLAALAVLLPELRLHGALPPLTPLNPEQERLRLFDAAAGLVESLTGPRPLLLVLEDLHWASESTLALLEFISRRTSQLPVLIIGTYREEDTHRSHPLRQMRRRLEQEKLAEHMALRRLDQQAVAAMLEQFLLLEPAVRETGGDLPQRLFTASEGNPLFLEMLLRRWQETGETDETLLPQRLKAAISLRLDQLSPPGRAYAEMAAVFGPLFDSEAAREAGGWDECQAMDALDELLDRRLVRDLGRLNEYTFAHHLIQADLYSEIPAARRARRHQRVAEVLESLYPERREELSGALAQHFDLGGDPARATPHYLSAARQRMAVFANDEALAYLSRALKLAQGLDESAVSLAARYDLLELREMIYHRRGQRTEQSADLQDMDQLAHQMQDPQRICLTLERQIRCQRQQEHHEQEWELVQALRVQAQALGDRRWQAVAWRAEGLCQLSLTNFQSAITCCEEALHIFQELGDSNGILDCCCSLGGLYVQLHQSEQAQLWIEKALAVGDQDPTRLTQTLIMAGANALITRDLERCLAYNQRALELALRSNDLNYQAAALNMIGQVYYHRFQMEDARRDLLQARELYQRIQKFGGMVTAMSNLALLETDLGHYAEALEYYRQITVLNQRSGDLYQQAIALLNQAYTVTLMEDYRAEVAFSRQGLEAARQIKNRFLEAIALGNLGEAERELGDPQDAILYLQEAIEIHNELGQSTNSTNMLADLALAYVKAGDLDQAVKTAIEVEQAYQRTHGNIEDPQRLLWAAWRVWQACGQAERARQAIATAYAVIQEKLASIPHPTTRQTYAHISYNRQIIAAHERGEWP